MIAIDMGPERRNNEYPAIRRVWDKAVEPAILVFFALIPDSRPYPNLG